MCYYTTAVTGLKLSIWFPSIDPPRCSHKSASKTRTVWRSDAIGQACRGGRLAVQDGHGGLWTGAPLRARLDYTKLQSTFTYLG